MKILVTGGTVFVSRFVAEYFVKKGHEVYVLNRNTRFQSKGVKLINKDRHNLGETLKGYNFDLVVDVTAYNETDICDLLDAIGSFKNYVFISSSAVYPQTLTSPFNESQPVGENIYWGDYGTNKIKAEKSLIERVPNAYILRPPYLYGAMNNLYCEAFVFECAEKNLPFYLPQDPNLSLQFFDIEDLCRFIEIIIKLKPQNHIFNVGNSETIDIKEWVCLCYKILDKEPTIKYVPKEIELREYFPFKNYNYKLDVTQMLKLMPETKPIEQGLSESYLWYKDNRDKVNRKNYLEYINNNF